MVDLPDLPSDPEFARKVEQTEVAAWLDLDPSLEGSRQFQIETVEAATLLLDRSRDWPHSRILNLGVVRPATAESIAKILQVTQDAGIQTLMTDVSPIARPGTIARLLTQGGFRQTERNVIVARSTQAMSEPASFFRIRPATVADRDAVFEIMKIVMPGAPDWCRLLTGQIGRPEWRFYVALEEGVAAGVAGFHISEDMAWLGPVWTLAEFRNRGTQAALVAYVVRDAAAAGVEWVTTSYPASVSGRTRNFDRLGFSIVYFRNHFVWEA